jgi:Uma2 family endonuclease
MVQRERAMTSTEFQVFAQDKTERYELIDGVLFMAARPIPDHQRFVFDLALLIQEMAPGGEVFLDINLHLAEGYDFEPNVLWIAEDSRCQETDTGFSGTPELVVEVLSASTAKVDKDAKFKAYERFGVREYWLADLNQRLVEVYQHDGERFLRLGAFGPEDSFLSSALSVTVTLAPAFARIRSS